MPPRKNASWKKCHVERMPPEYFVTTKKCLLRKQLFRLVNMLYLKTITCNIKNMLYLKYIVKTRTYNITKYNLQISS